MLARLTPQEQENALVFLLDIEQFEIKKDSPPATLIRRRIAARNAPDLEGLPAHQHKWQMEQFERASKRRLVDATEAQLQEWIQSNVLLQLANAPWDLADAELLPIAGPCTTCPKRTGANAALFHDITTDQDTCTDPSCFQAKQKALVARSRKLAEDAGTPLLKISAKSSNERLEQKPVLVEHGAATVVAKKPIKQGQWIAAEKGSCPATVAAIHVDGDQTGTTNFVCADQNCKVHKHQVTRAETAQTLTPAQKTEALLKTAALIHDEQEIRDAVFAAMLAKFTTDMGYLQELVAEAVQRLAPGICRLAGIHYPQPEAKPGAESWEVRNARQRAAATVLRKHVLEASPDELHRICFIAEMVTSVEVDEYRAGSASGLKQDRVSLWKAATEMKVSADRIAAKVEVDREKQEKAKAEAAAKVKPMPKALTPAQRKRVVEVQKARWAKRRDGKAAAAGETAEKVGA